ncbi:Kunitz/Bovine pancreatic trypsin inhibitor domain protein [Ancylostoma ceylanicum]|uniref:Kunitz/Bovine pancreatic trypsin inhibitor domain protein n=1 Tax=Ancylostoma ceylanicum TaxID=53326 RepID=A0A0D6LJN4_9BILA|nr:Kunitz/Bovine pancreatic trypsin inhibitor domain protein [Ancylostoma ceylanicum]
MRFLALLAACAVVAAAEAVDPCKRQPFRGRCPSKDGETPKRSQFVLRYYMRNGECVSYPYGHCASDETEPQLYRYKEECEDACINPPPANLGFPKGSEFDQTYGTVGPIAGESQTQAATEKVDITTETTTTQRRPQQWSQPQHQKLRQQPPRLQQPRLKSPPRHPKRLQRRPSLKLQYRQLRPRLPVKFQAQLTARPLRPRKHLRLPQNYPQPLSHPQHLAQPPDEPSSHRPPQAPENERRLFRLTPPTECERRRVNAASSTIRGAFVPACTAQGAFEKVQCEPDGRQCFCVDSRGIEIPNSRTRNGQKPDCDSIQSATVPKTKECVGAAVRGPCSASMNRWYYDEQEAKCRRFTYSGCGGNGNNYETEDACSQRCAPPPMGLPKCEKGEPLKTKLGVTVNCAKSDCPSGYKCSIVQQTSVCCPENDKIIGLQTTNPSDVCSMPKERGPCDKYELRFYFNAEVKECKYFFWGGCEGNGNNFEKVEECESACGIAKVKESLPTSTRPSTASNRQPHFRTTQGIRITPVGGVRSEETVAQESTTTPVTATAPTAAPLPSRHSPPAPTTSPRPSGGQSTADTTDSSTAASSVHVAPTRAPPIPQMALLEGSEESQAEGVNRCLHPKDPGNCRGQFIRWFWDNERKLCDVFTYTGCQGNGNNYASREECLAICHKEAAPVVVHEFANVCKHDVDAGECNGVFQAPNQLQRFAFDTESGECRPFTYGGCGGNGNNFATLAECRIKCQKVALSPGNLCEHDIEVGECSGVFVRFGYDRFSNDCRQFTYGGCGGNGNNFATIQECRNVCVKKVCNPNPQCDLARCQIVNDHDGCPFCSCPPTNQPAPPGSDVSHCPEVDVDSCKDPCIVINNRKGCKDCICPTLPISGRAQPPAPEDEPTAAPPGTRSTFRPVTQTPRPVSGSARPPASPTSVGPPGGLTGVRIAPPGTNDNRVPIRQEAVLTAPSTQTKQLEIDSKQLLPPPLSAQLQEKCMQPVEPGPCKHFVDRWFFNAEDGTCHPFKYGGCAGNRNHFFTQNECEIHCARFLHRVIVPSPPLHVHETERAVAEPALPPLRSVGLQADAERQHTVVFQKRPPLLVRPLPSHTITPFSAKPSNTPAYRESSPPTTPRPSLHPRTLAAANLPFDLPPSVRAHATGSESGKRSGVATTTYYPETYEAWGIDTNRHPELTVEVKKEAKEPRKETVRPKEVTQERREQFSETKEESMPKKERIPARSQPTFDTSRPLTIPREQKAREETKTKPTDSLTQFAGRNEQPVRHELPEKPTKEKQFVSTPIRPTILIRQPFLREETKTAYTTTTQPASNRPTQTVTGRQQSEATAFAEESDTGLERNEPSRSHSTESHPGHPHWTTTGVASNPSGDSAWRPPPRAVFHQKSHPVVESNSREGFAKPLEPLAANPRPRTDFPHEPQPAAGNWPPQAVARPTPPQVKVFVEDSSLDLDRNVVPRQYSTATHPRYYSMNSISTYNPQQNNNLAGLSPPVDPTYFTYNSQHLGAVRNRQFAVNSVPFDKQIILERNPWLQQNRLPQVRAMTPQIFSSAPQGQPVQQQPFVHPSQVITRTQSADGGVRPVAANSGQFTPEQARNPQSQAIGPREIPQDTFIQQNPIATSASPGVVLPHRGGLAENIQPIRTVQNTPESRSPQQTTPTAPSLPALGHQSDRPAWQGSHQRTLPAAGPQSDVNTSPVTSTHSATSVFSRTVAAQGRHAQEDTEKNEQAQVFTTSKSAVQQTPHVPEETRNNQQRLQDAGQGHQQVKHSREENPRQSATVTSARSTPSDSRNLQYPPAVKYRTSETRVSYAEENPQPTSRTEFPRRHIENNHMVVTLPEKTSSPVENDIVKTKAEWVNSRNPNAAKEDVRTSRTQGPTAPPRDSANEEFPAGLDRSQFIYYNGDYYAPTIPGIRVSRTGSDSAVLKFPLIEGPPEEMFREFQRHSKEFQNAVPFVNAARSAVEQQRTSIDNSPLDIMDKTLYLKQEGSVVNAPPVRVPDKRPRKLQELSEQFTTRDNEYPVFLRAPPPNSTRTQAPQHTLNQVNPIHDLPNDNFPKHMQVVNNTFTDLNTNRRQNDQRPNLSTRLNIRPISSFTGVVSGDDEEDEEDDDVEEVPRRAAGVTQMRTQEPIGVENYRSPTPFLRGVSTHPHAAHGKKTASVPVIPMEGMRSTASTETSEETQASEPRSSARTNRPPTITGQRVTRTTVRNRASTQTHRSSVHESSYSTSTPANDVVTDAASSSEFTSITDDRSDTKDRSKNYGQATQSTDPSPSEDHRTTSTSTVPPAASDDPTVTVASHEDSSEDTPDSTPAPSLSSTPSAATESIASVDLSTILSVPVSSTVGVSPSTERSTPADAIVVSTTTPLTTESTSSATTTTSEEPTTSRRLAETTTFAETTTTLPTTVEKKTENPLEFAFSEDEHRVDESSESEQEVAEDEEVERFAASDMPPPPPPPPTHDERQPAAKTAAKVTNDTGSQGLRKVEILPKVTSTTHAPTTVAVTVDSTTFTSAPANSTAFVENDARHSEDLSQPAPESSWEAPTSEEMPGYPMGREPVPLAPTGIGRNMAKLDLDGLGYRWDILYLEHWEASAIGLITNHEAKEEPTTIIPLATRSQTTASTTQSTTTASTTTTAATTTASTTTEATTEPTTEQTTQGTTTQAPTTTRAATSRPTPQTSAPLVITPPVPKTTAGSPAPSAAVLSARVVCTLPPDAGSCFEYVPRWFFNAQSGQCEQFSYGSCGGNENNFEDRSLCELKCIQTQNSILSHVPERCTYEKSAGFGKGYNVKWYFNMRNLRCEQFVYEGQGGNENQFETLSDCERACSPQPASFAPPVQTTTAATRPPAPATAPPQTLRPISETDESQNPSQEISEDIDQEYDELFSSLPPSAPITAAPTVSPSVSNSVDSRIGVIPRTAPLPPVPEDIRPPGSEPRPPAVQAAKTVIQKEQPAEIPTINVISTEKKKEVYKAEPLPSKPVTSDNEGLPIVGASPPMSVNYQTGEIKNRASGIRTFQESTGRLAVEDSDLTEDEAAKRRSSLSCPNGLQEIRYADGRPVMCLPGKNQCPEKSVCFFNGMDFFCCPNEEDPYDKHVFGGYDGEETKHGYKVFGPLNIRRLMDEVPLRVRRHSVLSRQKRQTSMDSAFNTAPASFNIDSVTAPLRFDDEKPRQVSRAQRMRSKPVPPNHGNPICIEPLVPGDCGAAHLRYYYDRDSDSCRLFYYTGCKGNNNNFGSLIDCQRLCVLEGQRPQPEGRSSTPPPAALRPGQCPDGKAPLGGSAPVLCGNSTDSIGCPVGFFCLAGPPDVCCPRAETEKKEEKSPVRFAPELPGVPRAHSRKAHLSTPKFMCPDASDPLMGQNGNPTPCGAGFDGVKMCPKGFYCAIDVEKQSRMCCPLYGAAERIPSEQVLAPYFGRRPSNPGEVVERGSLPSDQVEFASRSLNSKSLERIPDEESNEDAHPRAPVVEATTTSTFGEDSGEFDEMDEEEEEDGMAHLMLKPAEPSGSSPATSAQPNDSVSEAATEHAIDLPTEPPVVEETTSVKEVVDASVCQIKPSEGRTCREDEQPPRTNLHYFYSPKDRRCKLYFYRGCGGNANRFEKKADCERLCLQ